MRAGDVLAERFELLTRARAGGMGEVWRATDRTTGEGAAVKLLLNAENDAGRFAREARVLAELHHPSVVRYIAHGATSDGVAWLAMEWLDGEDLAARLTRKPLSSDQSIDLVLRAAEALAVAHARGIVHRDVKPGNLMLVGGDVVGLKLLDFGIARARTDSLVAHSSSTRAATQTGSVIGTPGYMAPEQARGERDVDARADVFSLGCVLYECLTGTPAFAGEHVIATLAKILLDEPPALDAMLVGAPLALVALVARMMAKDREKRPASARELAADLAGLTGMPSLRPGATSMRPPALTGSEQRMVSVVLAAPAHVTADTVTTSGEDATLTDFDGALNARLVTMARRFGGTLHTIAGGALLGSFAGGAEAPACAARIALVASAGSMRVGLATGRARVENSLPVGAAIDTAVALASTAEPGTVAVDPRTANVLGDRFTVRSQRDTMVLIGEPSAGETTRTLLGKPTPCVGRERDLAVLDSFWDECVRDARARPVLVTAAAGAGKSRLAHEFIQRVRSRDKAPEIWIGSADATSAGSPLRMLSEAMKRCAEIRDGEPIEDRRVKLRSRIARNVRDDVDRVTEFIGEMIGTPFPGESSAHLRSARTDARVMADQIRRAWEDFVIAECTSGPVLLVLEDLQWGDAATVSFIDGAMRALGEHPWMVLALGRPAVHTEFPDLWRTREVQEIRLGGLSRKASERLVRDALGAAADAKTVALVVERAEGNAFFLEELIRAVAAGRADSVPDTVLSMVEGRLAELDSEERRVVRAASVFGATFWSGAVQALLGAAAKKREVDAWLNALVEREMFHERPSRFPDEREYSFRHDLVRVAAYGTLVEHDRLLGHRLAAEWLERVGVNDALVIAEHFEKGGEPGRAIGAYLRAAQQADEANDLDAAVSRAERGIACGAAGETRGALRLVQASAHYWVGRREQALECGLEALTLLAEDAPGWFEAAERCAASFYHLGRIDELLQFVRRVEVTAPGERAAESRLRCLARSSVLLALAGQRERAQTMLDAAAGATSDATRAFAAQGRGALATHVGDVAALVAALESAERLFAASGDARGTAVTMVNTGYAYCLLGDYARAETTLRSVLAMAERMRLAATVSSAKENLCVVLERRGAVREALAMATEAAMDAERHRDARKEGIVRAYLARILLRADDVKGAEVEARRSLQLLSEHAPLRPHALANLACVERARGDLPAARSAIVDAMRGVDGAEEGEATIRLVHAEILHASGEIDAARAAIAFARERLLTRAALISEPTMRETFLTRVSENATTLALAARWIDARESKTASRPQEES